MAFIDKFIKLPIKLYSETQKDLTGKAEYVDEVIRVNPSEICSYRAQGDDENLVEECTSLTLKNGDRFNVYMTVSEFEQVLNRHFE